MSIRDALEDLLAGRGHDVDPTAVLSEHGFDDLPAEALSSALLHFSERASLEVADSLSPFVTRLSDVPFEEGDLTPHPGADAILADGGSVFDLLNQIELADETYDADPSQLDIDHDLDRTVDDDAADAADDDTDHDLGVDDDHTFGAGDDSPDPDAELDDDDTNAVFDEIIDDLGAIESTEANSSTIDDLDDHTGVHVDDLDKLLSSVDPDSSIDDDGDPLDFDLD
ncbi:MAG: hypothetical protein GY724_26935 [Actinomycetia bacterium]|nr:hypothetical protein [Actinomycetes bacterium]